ncbi:hypothetical protein HanRHA438_Chr15g0722471 [Helianthus annuus]|nr:hypothetical protein HanRHA438_Chr15g0722471 [Helianthus annuus]
MLNLFLPRSTIFAPFTKIPSPPHELPYHVGCVLLRQNPHIHKAFSDPMVDFASIVNVPKKLYRLLCVFSICKVKTLAQIRHLN